MPDLQVPGVVAVGRMTEIRVYAGSMDSGLGLFDISRDLQFAIIMRAIRRPGTVPHGL